MRLSTKKAFTLIELLVVIAIIALLLSILMPALTKVKKQAQAAICLSNIKQWGVIFTMYAQDNRDSFPQNFAGNGLREREAYWMAATMPYYQDNDLRFCPSAKRDKDNQSNGWQWEETSDDYGQTFESWGPFGQSNPDIWYDQFDEGSYGMNEWCSNPPLGIPDMWGLTDLHLMWRKTINITRANSVPLFLDCKCVDGYPRDSDPAPTDPEEHNGYVSQSIKMFCMDRHSGGINGVFVDASARKVFLKELWTLKWHKQFDTRGPQTKAGGATKASWPDWMKKYKEF